MFISKIRKLVYTLVNASLTIKKKGLRGSKYIEACFRDSIFILLCVPCFQRQPFRFYRKLYIMSLLTVMPPRRLILVLSATKPPGTNQGIRQHSPVLLDSSQITHWRQQHVLMTENSMSCSVKTFLLSCM